MRHRVVIDGVFHLEGGGTLRDVVVEARTWGRHRRSATLICHALTGDANADDWWRNLFGRGELFDPADHSIVAMNVLGSCYGTTGPPSVGPDGNPYGPDFPSITIRDMVRLQHATLERLGVTRLDLVIGGSMGGMQALEWAAMYPEMVSRAVPIGVGATQSAWAIGFSESQRAAILTDPAFEGGRYREGRHVRGLATARMIAMTSYRSPQNFDARFGRSVSDGRFEIGSYLRYQGDKLAGRFDANAYLTLIDAMDSHDVGRGRGPWEAILGRVRARALVIGISSDVLYPVAEVRRLAHALPNGRFAVLDSPHGHDAFLIETDKLSTLVRRFLEDDSRPAAGLVAPSPSGQGAAWA